MKLEELAWLAGLLEGEGSFMKAPPSDPGRPRISLQMTDEDVVARAAILLGVKYSTSQDRRCPAWKPTAQLQVKGKRAVHLMRELYPHMGQRRRQQILAALETYAPRDPVRKLTESNVLEIRASNEPSNALGQRLGISGSAVRRIRRRITWKAI